MPSPEGDAVAANAAADPTSFAEGVDPALLTGEMLASAEQRITVADVALEYDADLSADIVEVRVTYEVGSSGGKVVLRAQRAGTTAFLFDDWEVIDPLLVPVRITSNQPDFDTGSFGSATVPVVGDDLDESPEHRVFVYPAAYELHGVESLMAGPETVVASGTTYSARPANTAEQTVEASLLYAATPELRSTAAARLADHMDACFAPGPDVPKGCPRQLYAGDETDSRLVEQPSVEFIGNYQVEHTPEDSVEPHLRLEAKHGRLAYRDSDGDERTEQFYAYGQVVIGPGEQLTITFTTDL